MTARSVPVVGSVTGILLAQSFQLEGNFSSHWGPCSQGLREKWEGRTGAMTIWPEVRTEVWCAVPTTARRGRVTTIRLTCGQTHSILSACAASCVGAPATSPAGPSTPTARPAGRPRGSLPGELVRPPGRPGTLCACRPHEHGSVLALVPPGVLHVPRVHLEGAPPGEPRAPPCGKKAGGGRPVRSPSGIRVHRASLLWLQSHAAPLGRCAPPV